MPNIKKNFLNLFIIIFGCAAILIINNNAEDILNIKSGDLKTMPDNIFNKVQYIAMDDNGEPLYTVSSPRMKQYYENEVIEPN